MYSSKRGVSFLRYSCQYFIRTFSLILCLILFHTDNAPIKLFWPHSFPIEKEIFITFNLILGSNSVSHST